MNLGNNQNYGGEAKIVDQLDASDLAYLADEETNVVVERSQKKQFSQKNAYTQRETMVFTLNTGQDYISARNSSLKLTLNGLTAADAVTFGGGSILNVFENIRLISRDGSVLTEVSQLNLYNYFAFKLKHTHEWRTQQQGKKMLGANTTVPDLGANYVIPLKDIVPFFDQDVLIPANVARGLRIEITLAPVATAFQATELTAYTISKPELLLDSYRLSGGAMSALNQMAAGSGLVMTYKDVNNSNSEKAAAVGNLNLEARQAVSMANSVFTCVRLNDNLELKTADSFATREAETTDSFQYRIGSVYLPQERILGPVEYYAQTSYCYGKTSDGHEIGIREGAEEKANTLACATLDRYWTSGSGMAVNASTVLTFTAKVLADDKCNVDLFLCHTRRLTAFLENLTVQD
jgi:hypothetical protein